MAIDVLALPIPTSYPYNPWLDAQDRLADGLDLPAVPLTRAVDRHGATKALSKDAVKVIYVSRQATNRKLDDLSEKGLVRVLTEFAKRGVVGKRGDTAEVVVEVVEWEFLSAKEQIELAYSADVSRVRGPGHVPELILLCWKQIYIGIHGNGLSGSYRDRR